MPSTNYPASAPYRSTPKKIWSLKRLLISITALLILLMILYPTLEQWVNSWQQSNRDNAEEDNSPIAYSLDHSDVAEMEIPEHSTMINPHFKGMDKHNNPYNITADRAIQLSSDKVLLETIQGDLITRDDLWYSLVAHKGYFSVEQQALELHGDIILFSYNNYELRTEKAFVDLEKGRVSSKDPVEIIGDFGRIMSKNGMVYRQNKQEITFDGPVTVTITKDITTKKK